MRIKPYFKITGMENEHIVGLPVNVLSCIRIILAGELLSRMEMKNGEGLCGGHCVKIINT